MTRRATAEQFNRLKNFKQNDFFKSNQFADIDIINVNTSNYANKNNHCIQQEQKVNYIIDKNNLQKKC